MTVNAVKNSGRYCNKKSVISKDGRGGSGSYGGGRKDIFTLIGNNVFFEGLYVE